VKTKFSDVTFSAALQPETWLAVLLITPPNRQHTVCLTSFCVIVYAQKQIRILYKIRKYFNAITCRWMVK